MALTKDQYERLIAAAERIADALEGAAPTTVTTIPVVDEAPAERITEAAAPIPEPDPEPEPEATTAKNPATEEGKSEYTPEKLQELNEWLFQCATWLTQNGKSGVSVVQAAMINNGVANTAEITKKEQYDGIVAAVTAEMQGAG